MDMCKFYRDWHVKSDGVYGIFLHDPVSFLALVRPDLFTYKVAVVTVETQDGTLAILGQTILVSVAWTVNVKEVLRYTKKQVMKP
ncbi:Uridine nucleosidase 1-like protein [Drosera capensis]